GRHLDVVPRLEERPGREVQRGRAGTGEEPERSPRGHLGQGEGPVRKGPREACAARLEGLELAGAGEGRGLEELIFRVLEDRPRDGHLLPLDATTAPPTAAGSAPGSGHAAPRRRETVVGAAGGADRRAGRRSGACARPRGPQGPRRGTPAAREPPLPP